MRTILTSLAILIAPAANAEGFAVRDLSGLAAEASAALGPGFERKAASERVTLGCPTCKGGPIVDILLGRQDDGTEQRVRSGETSIASLERLCQAKSPTCRLTALSVSPAVGWITTYPLGGAMTGSTAVILRDGDLLTVRSVASDEKTARSNAQAIVKKLAPRIIGN